MLPPDLVRLLKILRPSWPWFAFGLGLAVLSFLIGLALSLSALLYFTLGFTSLVLVLRWIAPVRMFGRYCERLVTHSATFRALANLRLWFFRAVAPLAPSRLGLSRSGDLLSRITADIDALDGIFLRLIVPVAVLIFALAAFTMIGLRLMPDMVLLSACWGGLLALILRRVLKTGSQAGGLAVERLSALRTHVVDGIDGLGELIANEAGHTQHSLIAQGTRALVQQQLRVSRAALLGQALSGLFIGGTLAFMLFVGLTLPPEKNWNILLILASVMALGETLGGAIPGLLATGRLSSAAHRLFTLTDQTPAVSEPATPRPLPENLDLIFDNITLSYGRPHPALKNLSLTIAAQERVVLTGPSGAGKSSLIGLILGFYAPEAGRLLIGGVDAMELNRDALRQRLGYLSQRTQLLSGTVRANLRLANPRATEAEMWRALSDAEIDSVVKALPLGLDTWVGESGILLSGGQARRIAIAQLLLRPADIWLLDEPTEGLDFETAQAILNKISLLAGSRSVILITHQNDLIDAFGPARRLKLSEGQILPL